MKTFALVLIGICIGVLGVFGFLRMRLGNRGWYIIGEVYDALLDGSFEMHYEDDDDSDGENP